MGYGILNSNQLARLVAAPSGGVAIQGADGFPAIIIRRRTEQYGVVSDGVALYDVTASNSVNSVIQSASGAFTQDDVGKCCAVHSRSSTAALASARFGFIVSVQSATQCTTTLNLAPGALTNAMFVYGTDNATPMQAAINAAIASRDKTLYPQSGIICSSAAQVAAGNIIMEGAGRSYTEKEWYDFGYAGTTLVVCGYGANGALYAGNNTTGPRLYGFNIDAMGISNHALQLNGRAGHVSDMTLLKPVGGTGNSHAFKSASGSMVDHCTIIGGYNCHPFAANGDSQITHCNIYGTGTGYFAIKASASPDLIIAHNHMWAPGSGLFNAGSVFVEAWQTTADLDSIQITNNQFDTAKNAPHISVSVAAGCSLRGLNISDNNSFNNDSVTTPYPWLSFSVAATGDVRGVKIDGNIVLGSWQTPTAGVHSYLIDGTGIAGTVKGVHVADNIIDRPSVGSYNTFTPAYSAGNIMVDDAGTETVF